MMSTEKYNGWTNYETWNVALWLGNEQGSSEYWAEQADHAYKWANDRGVGLTKEEQAAVDLAAMLKDEFEEAWQDIADRNKIGASVWADLMGAALSEVDWHEIAEHYIADVEKGEPEPDEE